MKSLFAAMLQDNSIRKLQKYFSGKARTLVYGLGNSQKHAAFAACFRESSRPTVILVHSQEILEAWEEDLRALLPDVPVLELPEMDSIRIQAQVPWSEDAHVRRARHRRPQRGADDQNTPFHITKIIKIC